jgi:hypothetical protein
MEKPTTLLSSCYRCYKRGLDLTDEAIEHGASEFPKLAEQLFALGPEFVFAAADLQIMGTEFQRIKEARENE